MANNIPDNMTMEESIPVEQEGGFSFKEDEADFGSFKIRRQSEVTYNTITIDADYEVRKNDRFVFCSAGGLVVATLPESDAGKVFTLKNLTALTFTIDGGLDNIDGSGSISLTSQYESITVVYNGTEWSIISLI